MVGWNYLDKRDATIKVLKDYDSMKFIIENTSDEIKRVTDKAVSVGVPKYDDHVRSGNIHSGEDKMANIIEEIDILKERYRQAMEYMDWFQPAWEQLTEDERYVLESFYSDVNCYGSNAAYYIASHFGIEQSSAYKRKNRALDRLTVLLFGKA